LTSIVQKGDVFGSGIPYMPHILAYTAGWLKNHGIETKAIDSFGENPFKITTKDGFCWQGITIDEILKRVGLKAQQMRHFPHEFSGGQRQRIAIARALVLHPKFVVADEPVSALDVSIQAQIINLLLELQDELNLTYLLIAHDLAVVEYISDTIAVMYLGSIVETAKDKDLYSSPMHPYTQALISAIPQTDPRAKKTRIILKGDVPSPINPPAGCTFHTRCHRAMEICGRGKPPVVNLGNLHLVSCFLYV